MGISKNMRLTIVYYKLMVFIHNFLWNKIPRSWSMVLAGKIDFDNLVKVISAVVTYNAATIVSQEIELDLPRGYIAKIHKVLLRVDGIQEDFEDPGADQSLDYSLTLIRDPDDTTSDGIGENLIQQDSIMWHKMSVVHIDTAVGNSMFATLNQLLVDFSNEGLDLVTARNMRLNAVAGGAQAATATEAVAVVIIWYSLEKVTDIDILNLLDIL